METDMFDEEFETASEGEVEWHSAASSMVSWHTAVSHQDDSWSNADDSWPNTDAPWSYPDDTRPSNGWDQEHPWPNTMPNQHTHWGIQYYCITLTIPYYLYMNMHSLSENNFRHVLVCTPLSTFLYNMRL